MAKSSEVVIRFPQQSDIGVFMPTLPPLLRVPVTSRQVRKFLFQSSIENAPVNQCLLQQEGDFSTAMFYRGRRYVGRLLVSREVLTGNSLHGSLVVVAREQAGEESGTSLCTCVFPIGLREPNKTQARKYVSLAVGSLVTQAAIKSLLGGLVLVLSGGTTFFAFPAIPPIAAATAFLSTVPDPIKAGVVSIGISMTSKLVLSGVDLASGGAMSKMEEQKNFYRQHFIAWMGEKRLPRNAVGVFVPSESHSITVRGVVLSEEMNHLLDGYGFINISTVSGAGVCLSVDVLGSEKIFEEFSEITGAEIKYFRLQDVLVVSNGETKITSLSPLSPPDIVFIDVKENWQQARFSSLPGALVPVQTTKKEESGNSRLSPQEEKDDLSPEPL